MARWDIYNIVGDATPLLDYEVQSRDFDWNQQINPTPDVGLAFRTIVRALSEDEKKWTEELFTLLGENGGGRIIKYEGSTVDGTVTCHDIRIDENGDSKQVNQWSGTHVDIYRVSEDTIFDKADHDWTDINKELTIKSIPYDISGTDYPVHDPDPRFNLPLMKVIQDETGVQTVYMSDFNHEWRVSGSLPNCVYVPKEIPEHIKERNQA